MGTILSFIAGLINRHKLRSFWLSEYRVALAERLKEIRRDPKTIWIDRGFGRRK